MPAHDKHAGMKAHVIGMEDKHSTQHPSPSSSDRFVLRFAPACAITLLTASSGPKMLAMTNLLRSIFCSRRFSYSERGTLASCCTDSFRFFDRFSVGRQSSSSLPLICRGRSEGIKAAHTCAVTNANIRCAPVMRGHTHLTVVDVGARAS